MKPIADLRKDYTHGGLSEAEAGDDPFALFRSWFDAAQTAGLPEPNAMTLATADVAGKPAARIVLLKGFDERGFVFFSNYDSRKGREMETNPFAALVFLWHEFERSIRIEGGIQKTTDEESDAYFSTRPAGSRLGAWASRQSEVIPDRSVLEAEHAALLDRFADGEIPRPPHWGGYRLVPNSIEFWQGRSSRLHDRLRFRSEGSQWIRERLAP